jgi:hypothetical protein
MPFGMKTPRRCRWVDNIYGFQPKNAIRLINPSRWHWADDIYGFQPIWEMNDELQQRHEVATCHQLMGNALGIWCECTIATKWQHNINPMASPWDIENKHTT